MKNFWKDLPKPFFALAPMADVTDVVFRQMFVKYGKPDILWTEFVSADGLFSDGADKVALDLEFEENEHPIVAQFFTSKPENMSKAAKYALNKGFDGVDINMGCPDRSVEKQGCGADLIKNPDLAVSLINAAKEIDLPVSVKTRTGYNNVDIEGWITKLLETKISALTVHLRTRKEMSKVDANWELLDKIILLRNKISPETLIIGNGDIKSIEEGLEKIERYKCDGVMIGRGCFGAPWFFNKERQVISSKEKLEILLEHTKLFNKKFSGVKNFAIMKKHFKAYVNGFEGAKELREKLMQASDVKNVLKIIDNFKGL